LSCENPKDLKAAKRGDSDAAGRVLLAHQGLIVKTCESYLLPGYEIDDLMQVAYMAGLDAIKWFKPELGFQFNTYLMSAVRKRLSRWRDDRRQRPFAGYDDATLTKSEVPETTLTVLTPLEFEVLASFHGLERSRSKSSTIAVRFEMSKETIERLIRQAETKLQKSKL
jgi:DNA-directed RNA polymerase specialized sigma24 family protein